MPRVANAKIVHVGDDQWHYVGSERSSREWKHLRFTLCNIELTGHELSTMRSLSGSGVTNICKTCSGKRQGGGG